MPWNADWLKMKSASSALCKCHSHLNHSVGVQKFHILSDEKSHRIRVVPVPWHLPAPGKIACDNSVFPLQWCPNDSDGVSNHQPHDCLPKRLFKRRSKKTSKLRVTALCEGNSPVTGEFPAQRASNAEIDSIWWRHHARINDSAWWSSSV